MYNRSVLYLFTLDKYCTLVSNNYMYSKAQTVFELPGIGLNRQVYCKKLVCIVNQKAATKSVK